MCPIPPLTLLVNLVDWISFIMAAEALIQSLFQPLYGLCGPASSSMVPFTVQGQVRSIGLVRSAIVTTPTPYTSQLPVLTRPTTAAGASGGLCAAWRADISFLFLPFPATLFTTLYFRESAGGINEKYGPVVLWDSGFPLQLPPLYCNTTYVKWWTFYGDGGGHWPQ